MTFRYSDKGEEKGVVTILNSYYMHSKYTAHLAKRLSEEGFTAVTYDMRGHGLSEGERGQWNDYREIINETKLFLLKVQNMFKKN